ncbi:MAG: hypothetical protein HC923_12515 [Myxococcales bacterium]|nr:hypothetical protein [Myxococcales bacterium]
MIMLSNKTWWSILAILVLAKTGARAEPLVVIDEGGVRPAVVSAWSGDGRQVELTVRPDADPKAVADAIQVNVERVKAQVRAGRVIVVGKSVEELLPLLAEVELSEGEPLTELAQLSGTGDDFGSGTSLRAKKKAALDAALADPTTTVVGQVVSVESGTFPRARVKVRILVGPRGSKDKKLARGKVVTFVPELGMVDGKIDFDAELTQRNAGAFYLEPKDRVRIQLGPVAPDGSHYLARAMTR